MAMKDLESIVAIQNEQGRKVRDCEWRSRNASRKSTQVLVDWRGLTPFHPPLYLSGSYSCRSDASKGACKPLQRRDVLTVTYTARARSQLRPRRSCLLAVISTAFRSYSPIMAAQALEQPCLGIGVHMNSMRKN